MRLLNPNITAGFHRAVPYANTVRHCQSDGDQLVVRKPASTPASVCSICRYAISMPYEEASISNWLLPFIGIGVPLIVFTSFALVHLHS